MPPPEAEPTIGLGNYPIRADLPEELPAGTQVSVEFPSMANWQFRLLLYDAKNPNLAGMKTDKIPTGMGACSDPQFGARGRARVTARADASFKWVLMSGVLKEGANDTASFVIDNFKIQR